MERSIVRLVLSLKMFKANVYVKFACGFKPGKKYNKTSATSEESTTGKTPFVLNLNGNFVIIYNILLIKQFRPALFTLSYLQIFFQILKIFQLKLLFCHHIFV